MHANTKDLASTMDERFAPDSAATAFPVAFATAALAPEMSTFMACEILVYTSLSASFGTSHTKGANALMSANVRWLTCFFRR